MIVLQDHVDVYVGIVIPVLYNTTLNRLGSEELIAQFVGLSRRRDELGGGIAGGSNHRAFLRLDLDQCLRRCQCSMRTFNLTHRSRRALEQILDCCGSALRDTKHMHRPSILRLRSRIRRVTLLCESVRFVQTRKQAHFQLNNTHPCANLCCNVLFI